MGQKLGRRCLNDVIKVHITNNEMCYPRVALMISGTEKGATSFCVALAKKCDSDSRRNVN